MSPKGTSSTNEHTSKRRYASWDLVQCLLVGLNISIRIYSALYMIIADCDETFNYWEPLNLLFRRFGKQTWEYSPEFALRDYVYLFIYYIVGSPIQFASKYLEGLPYHYSYYQFYAIRVLALCGFTSYTEISLFNNIKQHIGSRVASWFLLFTSIAPGMSHAGVALLPSSFAMQCNTLAISYGISAFSGDGIADFVIAILLFVTGGLIGWPFALALGLTFGLYTLFNIKLWKDGKMLIIIGGCASGTALILAVVGVVNSYLYCKYLLVPLNIVLYNVFGGEGEGPEIFGVEPFSYYILNLLLNFNVVFPLAYAGSLMNPFLYSKSKLSFVVASMPLLIWSFIFFGQPHKEERFLYPIYPLICLNAALLTSKLFSIHSQIFGKVVQSPNYIRRVWSAFVQGGFALAIITVSILRIINLVENYSAPLVVFSSVAGLPQGNDIQNVCIGREWYHYPNSFFLPDNYRLRFVKSGFNGLLPGDFNEEFSTLREQTAFVPQHMNNKNQFEEDKVVTLETCDYYVDNTEPVAEGELQLVLKDNGIIKANLGWDILKCHKLLRPDGHHDGIGRFIYIPMSLRLIVRYNVEYMEFCVLKRKNGMV